MKKLAFIIILASLIGCGSTSTWTPSYKPAPDMSQTDMYVSPGVLDMIDTTKCNWDSRTKLDDPLKYERAPYYDSKLGCHCFKSNFKNSRGCFVCSPIKSTSGCAYWGYSDSECKNYSYTCNIFYGPPGGEGCTGADDNRGNITNYRIPDGWKPTYENTSGMCKLAGNNFYTTKSLVPLSIEEMGEVE